MFPRPKPLGVLTITLVCLIGCSDDRTMMSKSEENTAVAQFRQVGPGSMDKSAMSPPPAPAGMMGMMGGVAPPAADRAESATPIPPAVDRKIIYNGRIEMNVEDMTASEQALKNLITQAKGYISETDVSGNSGSRRRGTWKVRVPVEGFSDSLSAVAKLGELLNNHTDSQDVTAEFYDIDARIKNKQQEEVRLKKILDEATGKLKDILEVEKEITRVRGEIEQMQGRLRVLASLPSLSTVSVTMSEVETFKPLERPTFAQLIVRTFRDSTERLTIFLGGIVLSVVSFIPWLSIWVPILAAVWVAVRVWKRWLKSRPAGEPAIPAPAVTS